MKRSKEMSEKLNELDSKRKNGEISAVDYYKGLMDLLLELAGALKEEELKEEDVKKQIPLLKIFLSDQLKKMEGRGN